MKKLIIFSFGVIAILYIFNIGVGIIELIPDNFPIIGNLDEATAVILLLNCLNYFGIDLVNIFKKDQAKRIIDLGFYLGIGGVVTFKNSGLDLLLENIPLGNIVLETDSPYLAPAPFRGKRNEPSYIPIIAKKLAEIYKVRVEEIAKVTTENARKIFKEKGSEI